MEEIEKQICRVTWDEGIGSVYERIVLHRFLNRLNNEFKFNEVLEYGCPITKGYDNIAFLPENKVTITDINIDAIKKEWKFENVFPEFKPLNEVETYDLVWNFASVQLNPDIIEEMLKFTKKYILVFVPNVLNLGSPFHFMYHLLTRQKCAHAERGKFSLRTRGGLIRFLQKNKIAIIRSGFIDMPPIPDIGFSRKELKQWLGIKKKQINQKVSEINYDFFEKLKVWENKNYPDFVKAFISHHIYVFGEKLNG